MMEMTPWFGLKSYSRPFPSRIPENNATAILVIVYIPTYSVYILTAVAGQNG